MSVVEWSERVWFVVLLAVVHHQKELGQTCLLHPFYTSWHHHGPTESQSSLEKRERGREGGRGREEKRVKVGGREREKRG